MKVNSQVIVAQRESRAWSQQQLADIAGINLRTIQRVESSGKASPDSVQAIASAFDVIPDQLFVKSPHDFSALNRVTTNITHKIKNIESRILYSSFFLAVCSIAIITVMLKSNAAVADGKYYFQGSLLIDDNFPHRFEISIPTRNVYLMPSQSDVHLLIIAPDGKSDKEFTEARLVRRNGATSYEVLHRAKMTGSSDRSYGFSYRVCGGDVIFYNQDRNDIASCTRAELVP